MEQSTYGKTYRLNDSDNDNDKGGVLPFPDPSCLSIVPLLTC